MTTNSVKMAKHFSPVWLNEHHALVDYTDTAKAPSKDFFHVFVTPNQFIFRVWKIVPPTRADSHTPPYEYKDTFEEFKEDSACQSDIERLAGAPTLNFLLALVEEGKLDFICRMPRSVQIQIILNLDLEDIQRLGRTCRMFREVCDSCDLWKMIYHRYSETPITPELEQLALERGWRRLFFTNKLQLQMQLRRLQKHDGSHAFVTEMETA
ncbi:F-box only protein 36-like [Ostrea edulis]|uniref:F-box only protein 36-like n=1 Tax=Ostrea edulis TaxID=37623 RepID=UPI002095BA3F|nr:F-box only protein 36-like [Ostrea edulis]